MTREEVRDAGEETGTLGECPQDDGGEPAACMISMSRR